uniref:INTS6/SAGE1/DDX26B/CT45 C-terminal domain-containing protein n=1 Tax=Macaca nemestrina TaxID=9545 RepID=A0A2K6DNL3_MACNE
MLHRDGICTFWISVSHFDNSHNVSILWGRRGLWAPLLCLLTSPLCFPLARPVPPPIPQLRARGPACRGDRYMLVTFEEPPYAIKAEWKENHENHATFMNELKNLQAEGLTTLGQSLRTAFDLLNLNRLVTGIDNYGQRRTPFFLKSEIIITVIDGSKLTITSGVQDELHLPLNSPLPGSESTKEPFHWDQRLLESEQLTVTGSHSYFVCSPRTLNQCLESLVQKVQSGVVINFEKAGSDPSPVEDGQPDISRPFGSQPWHSCHKLVYVRPNPKTGIPIGHWPIPESFWPDQNSPALPPHTSHPVVKFSCTDCEPMVIDKLPCDKYELEPSPLTKFILERKSPQTCWQVYVSNSAKYSELGHPFGYLKASTALNCVNLFVMAYNYPVLLPLLDDLFKVCKAKPTLKWRQSFESCLKTMPPYYLGPLKKAVSIMGAPNLIADSMEYGLSYSVISHLKKLSQQAKIESDRVTGSVVQETGIKLRNFQQLLQGISEDVPHRLLDLNMKEYIGFQVALLNKDLKMRSNLLKHTLHSVPIAQMGNYQKYLKQVPSPLRELNPDQPQRLHTFGNPFKLDKKGMMIDEADEFVAGPQNKHKRPGEPNMQGIPKRHWCMSPLLKGRQQNPVVSNHVGGKGPPVPITQAQPDLIKPLPLHKISEIVDLIVHDVVENHVADQLSSDITPNAMDTEFSTYSPVRTNDLTVGGFLENYEEPRDKEQCAEKNIPASSLNKGKKVMHCKSREEVNTKLKAQLMKEIRKPGRKYERIFTLLKHVQGSLQTRLIFLQNVIKENFVDETHQRANRINHINNN